MPEPALTYELTEGALDTLDEFSSVIWPKEMEGFSRNFQGEFFGVGIQFAAPTRPHCRCQPAGGYAGAACGHQGRRHDQHRRRQ